MISGFDNSNLPTDACAAPPPITTTQALVANAAAVTFSWVAYVFDLNPVVGYQVQYRAPLEAATWSDYAGGVVAQAPEGYVITVLVEGLNSATVYEFRVRPVLETDCAEVWDAVFTKVKLPPITPFTDPNFETWLQPSSRAIVASPEAGTSWFLRAAPINDNTQFFPQVAGLGYINGVATPMVVGSPVTLNAADYADFPADAPTVLQADGPASVICFERRDSDGAHYAHWSPARPWHLSTDLIFGAFRNTNQIFHLYALPGTAPAIEVWRQGATEAADALQTTLTGVGDNAIRFEHFDASAVYGFRSEDPVVAMHWSFDDAPRLALDQKVINPPALRIIMAETRNAAIAARYDGTAPSGAQSDVGDIGAVPVSREQGLVYPGAPGGPGQYAGAVVQFDGGNLPIVGGPGADGDGTAQTLGQDIDLLGVTMRVPGPTPSVWQFLKVASPFPFTLDELDATGAPVATRAATGVGPYSVYVVGPQPGHLFTASSPCIFVLEDDGTDDETVIWGAK